MAITLGASSVNFNTVFQVFGDLFVHNDAITETQRQIVLGIRLPRVLAAILAGIALSNAGLLMQGVFQNPLVSPYTLGFQTELLLARLWQLYLVPILLFEFRYLFTACICFH